MGKPTTLEERVMIMEMWRSGYSDKQISQELNRSYSVIRKWRRRGLRDGYEGLISQMGRPNKGFLSSFSDELVKKLRELRNSHSGWGATTLLTELQEVGWPEEDTPGLASINRFLEQEDQARSYNHHTDLPTVEESKPTREHEEWEMDARGHSYIPDVGVVALVNLNELFSHARLLGFPCLLGNKRLSRRLRTEDYQLILRLAFTDWGMPDRLSVDHETVFYDNDNPSPYPTRFHLWLIALGVELTFGRKSTPTDQAMTERSHQLWFNQVVKDQRFANWESLYLALRKRRDFLNEKLPCSSVGNVPILKAFPKVAIPRRPYKPEWEENIFDIQRIHQYLAKGKWFRKVSRVGTISLGGYVYNVGKEWAKQQIEITFDLIISKLVFQNPQHEETKVAELKGCSKTILMGTLNPWNYMPNFQLSLPFSWHEFAQVRLFDTAGGTT